MATNRTHSKCLKDVKHCQANLIFVELQVHAACICMSLAAKPDFRVQSIIYVCKCQTCLCLLVCIFKLLIIHACIRTHSVYYRRSLVQIRPQNEMSICVRVHYLTASAFLIMPPAACFADTPDVVEIAKSCTDVHIIQDTKCMSCYCCSC